MEPERRRHQFQPLRALRARASRQAGPRNTTQESSKFFIGETVGKKQDESKIEIKDEAARMKVTPPLAVAPLAHGDDMRWNPNDDGINFNP